MLTLSATVGIFSITQLDKVNQASTAIGGSWLPSIRTVDNLKLSLSGIRSIESQLGLYEDDDKATTLLEARINTILKKLSSDLNEYERHISDPEDRLLYVDFSKAVAALQSENEKMMAAIKAKDIAVFKKLYFGQSDKIYFSAIPIFDRIAILNVSGADIAIKDAEATFDTARAWIVTLLLASTLVGFGARTIRSTHHCDPIGESGECCKAGGRRRFDGRHPAGKQARMKLGN